MYLVHFVVLGPGYDVDVCLGSFQLSAVSRLQLSNLALDSSVLLVRGDDLVGKLLADDVRDVVAFLVTFLQQLNTTATTNCSLGLLV